MLNEFYGLTPRGKPTTKTERARALSNWRITARSTCAAGSKALPRPRASRACDVRGVLIKDQEMSIMARISRKALNERRSVHCLGQLGARWSSSLTLPRCIFLFVSSLGFQRIRHISARIHKCFIYDELAKRRRGLLEFTLQRHRQRRRRVCPTRLLISRSPFPFPSSLPTKRRRSGGGDREENHRSCT